MKTKPPLDTRPYLPGYLAGSDGRVYSCKRGPSPKPLKPRKCSSGYFRVRIYSTQFEPRAYYEPRKKALSGPKFQDVYVHVIICTAWHGPRPYPEAIVLHADANRTNNQPHNLSWGSQSQNALEREWLASLDSDGANTDERLGWALDAGSSTYMPDPEFGF